MLTLAAARNSRLKRISGLCTTSQDFVDILNDATQELMERGAWWNTTKVYRGCVYNACITWMRQVGSVLALNDCRGSAPPVNQWGQFDAVLPEHVDHWNRHGTFLSGCNSNMSLADNGTSPVFNQIPCLQTRFVQFYIVNPADVGKTITLFGIDGNGQEIITTRSDGTVQPGIVLVLAIPFVQTPMPIQRVDRIIKDPTVQDVFGYQFDGINRFPLATYAPNETLPSYRTSRLTHSHICCPSQISAFVKLEFVPVVNDDDEVQIDCIEALALAIQSIKLGDAFDSSGAETMLSRAVHVLNLQLRNKLQNDTIPVRFSPQGTASLRRQKIGVMQ